MVDLESQPAVREAVVACEFVAAHVRESARGVWLQGMRVPPLSCRSDHPAVRLIAERRLFRVTEAHARGLTAWADGRRSVELRRTVASAREIVALQAHGGRCVTLLDDDRNAGVHETALGFALHDLAHLEKFADAAHHAGQVGLFRLFHRAFVSGRFDELDARFDAQWIRERDAVLADMNGSAVFLFAALKMKLKMASRRRAAHLRGQPPRVSGALDSFELAEFEPALDRLLSILDFDETPRIAASEISARRDAPRAAEVLLGYFERMGG